METVRFYDAENKRVIDIPAAELAPGAIQVQHAPSGEMLWTLPGGLDSGGPLLHPPFPEHVREVIKAIKETFDEHYTKTFEEWEEGFRQDEHPEREIVIWMRAADTYQRFTRNELLPHRRADVCRVILACMTAAEADVGRILNPGNLKRREADKIVHYYYHEATPKGEHWPMRFK